MGDGRDIEINGRVIGESTKISLTVKTALWIIGGIIVLFSSIFTYTYFDMKAEIEGYKMQIEKSNQDFVSKVQSDITTTLDKQRDRDDKFIEDIGKIQGDIKLLLDRTQYLNSYNITDGTPTINNNKPGSVAAPRNH